MVGWVMGLGRNVDLTRETDLQIREKCDDTTEKIVKLLEWDEDFEKIEKTAMSL